jgi:hypothetical protein
MKVSVCCGAEQTDDIFHHLCTSCQKHCSWEELCEVCDEPCLLDDEEVGETVIYNDTDEAVHWMCVNG